MPTEAININIITLVREILAGYEKISEFSGDVAVDFTKGAPTDFGISSVGDTLVSEDVIGNQKRRHSFVLYAIRTAYTDYNRLANSTFLLDLAYWLERRVCGDEISGTVEGIAYTGNLIKLSSANAMIYELLTDDINDGVKYQIQIYADYKINA